MTEVNNTYVNNKLEVGDIFYHWRYGEMKVREIRGEFIIMEVENILGIKKDKILKDPWQNHLGEIFKKFPKNAIDKWLFKVPERVGTSKPAYGNRSFFSDEAFLRKLHNGFDKELVMECRNNYAKYLSKYKAQKAEGEQSRVEENNYAISEKEIDELVKIKEEYIFAKKEKEEELEYILNKERGCKEQLLNLDNNINRCKRKIGEKEKRIEVRENELNNWENESNSGYNKSKGVTVDIEREISSLEETIDELKGEINEVARNIEKINKDQNKLEGKKSILNKEIEELNNKISNLDNDIKTLV